MATQGHGDDTEALHVYAEDNVDRLEESMRVTVYGKELSLSLLLKEDELAPLFSGAAWAGTLLWDAAVHLTRHFLAKYHSAMEQRENQLRVIELGAGIGVPGMAARIAGARHVIITEQDDLLELMHRNLATNAGVLGVSSAHGPVVDGSIVARPLSWGIAETNQYLDAHADERIDVIMSCDCIYEPLYGEAWKLLAQTMELLCIRNPHALVLMGVERRNKDGVEKFLAFIDEHTRLQYDLHESAMGMKQNRLELYYLRLEATA